VHHQMAATAVFRSSLQNLFVIPGKLAIASATRNPGWSNISGCRFSPA
jgi:hypothetical protein